MSDLFDKALAVEAVRLKMIEEHDARSPWPAFTKILIAPPPVFEFKWFKKPRWGR